MYHEAVGPAPGATVSPAICHVDFVLVGGADVGRLSPPEAFPLSQLYFCDGCSRIVCRRDLGEDVDSYFCPHCLENMPSSEAMMYGMRCSKCWECPVCSCTLAMQSVTSKDPAMPGQTYHLSCGYCRWSSKGRLEAPQPEQLISQVTALEREGEPKQRMAALVDCFRSRAQEQQREKELAQRLVRRSSMARSSFAASALSVYAARRYSTSIMNPMGRGGRGGGGGSVDGAGEAGQWRMELLTDKLDRREQARKDIRYEARTKSLLIASAKKDATSEDAEASPDSGVSTSLSAAGRGRVEARKSGGGGAVPAGETPVLNGLSVEELIGAHVAHGEGGYGSKSASLVEQMESQLTDTKGQMTMMHKLSQVSYGYQRLDPAAPLATLTPGTLRVGIAQMEAPALHADAWTLLPVRKPLLTKRSRRCRLLARPEEGHAKFSDEQGKPCGKVVVKPQINPCVNPPFQKCNVAMHFVPKISGFMWKAETGDAILMGAVGKEKARAKGLLPDESCELVFIMANPLDTEVEVSFDPTYFNKSRDDKDLKKAKADCPMAAEQNVEVTSGDFKTEVDKFNDLTDVHDQLAEESDKNKQLKEKDNKEVIPNRKLHKLLCRVKFKRLKDTGDVEAPWIFFARLGLVFTDSTSVKHDTEVVVRFAQPTAPPKHPETAAEAQRRQERDGAS